uniref:Uncharacterized protein n=1 Tax=Globisporangium ultimum (strain ATCC 200006 / CBS 805.95 / DAOM BR144) TaxID=431595 RepID=K3WGP8_GLOUD
MSFDDMKRQYLLPFKYGLKKEIDVLTTFGMKHNAEPAAFVNIPALSERSPNAAVHLLGRRVTQRRIKCMEERVIPPDTKIEVVLQMQKAFYTSLPLAVVSIRDEHEKFFLFEVLVDPKMTQLVQEMSRYLYQHTFVKFACFGAESTFAKIKQTIVEQAPEKGLTLFLPLLLLGLRVAIETIYRIQYPVSFNTTASTMQYILMQLDDAITKMLDPDAHLSRIGVLETTCEATKIMASHPFQLKKRQLRLRDQFYKTSEALHSIFPRPVAGKCRKIIKLHGGASIANYPPHMAPPEEINNNAAHRSPHSRDHDPTVSVAARLQLLRIIERKGRRSI